MLGLDCDSIALDIGCGWGAITHALSRMVKTVYSIDAVTERLEFTQERLRQEGIENVRLFQASALELPFSEKSFDLVVCNGIVEWIGDWDLAHEPNIAQRIFLSNVQRILKDEGVLVIGIENRFGYYLLRGKPDDHTGVPYTSILPRRLAGWYLNRWNTRLVNNLTASCRSYEPKQYRTYTYSARGYRKLLRHSGFAKSTCCWSNPGYNQPSDVIPVEATEDIRQKFLADLDHLQSTGSGSALLLKRAFGRLGLFGFVVPAFVIFARKSNQHCDRLRSWIGDRLKRNFPFASSIAAHDIEFRLETVPFDCKHTLQICGPKAVRGTVIVKAEAARPGLPSVVQTEFTNLERIYSHRVRQSNAKLAVPEPLGSITLGKIVYTMETAACGAQLSAQIRQPKYFSSAQARNKFRRVFQAITDLTVELRDLHLTASTCPDAYRIPDALSKEPSLKEELRHLRLFREDTETVRSGWTQHGDLTCNNIFLPCDSNRIEFIDWATLGGYYPPLYDHFCFLTSIGYLSPRSCNPETRLNYQHASFIDTFYSDSEYSRFFGDLFCEAAEQLQVDYDWLPACFIEFLLFRTNYHASRGRLGTTQALVFEKFVRHAVGNKNRLLFGRFAMRLHAV